MNKQKESKIYSDPGLSLADKLNLDRIRELNDRRTAYLREAELNQPSVIDGGDFHGEKLMRDTKKLPYIASKGTVKELEEYFENHPAFNWDLENPEDFDREEKRVEELRKALTYAAEKGHLANLRLICTKYGEFLDLDYQYPPKGPGLVGGNTVAMQANRLNNFTAVLFLLRMGARLDVANDNKETLLTMEPLSMFVARPLHINRSVMEETFFHARLVERMDLLGLFPNFENGADEDPNSNVMPWMTKRSVRGIIFSYLFYKIKGYEDSSGAYSELLYKERNEIF